MKKVTIKSFAFLFVILLFQNLAWAQTLPSSMVLSLSAVRQPDQDWQQALQAQSVWDATLFSDRPSALNSAKYYSGEMEVQALPEWPGSESQLQAAFEELRDQRIYNSPNQPNSLRRSTWLYPRDGCFARAAHAARYFESKNLTRPGKIFAFGNLRAQVFYSPKNVIYWSYHVAAAFRIGNRVLVLDPSVDPFRPLSLEIWLSKISSGPTSVKVALCDTYAYTPESICRGGSSLQEDSSVDHQKYFLPKEWNYLLGLRFSPERLTGDEPPWAGRQHPIIELDFGN